MAVAIDDVLVVIECFAVNGMEIDRCCDQLIVHFVLHRCLSEQNFRVKDHPMFGVRIGSGVAMRFSRIFGEVSASS